MNKKNYAAIYAVSENDVIGHENSLPWDLQKADLSNFMTLTKSPDRNGNPPVLICGGRTLESLGYKPLKNRLNIVMTTNPDKDELNEFKEAGGLAFTNKQDLLAYLDTIPNEEIFIIGGRDMWVMFWKEIGIVYKTEIRARVKGAILFPPTLSLESFTEILSKAKNWPVDEKNQFPSTFRVYKRPGHYTLEQRLVMEKITLPAPVSSDDMGGYLGDVHESIAEEERLILAKLQPLELTYDDLLQYKGVKKEETQSTT
nr:Dihydrofolate reductase [uncultured bacterium]AIA13374.1 Dihydrofolate reductase [uncultured bacterium]